MRKRGERASERRSAASEGGKERRPGCSARIRHTRISRPASKVRRKRQLPSLRLFLAYIGEEIICIYRRRSGRKGLAVVRAGKVLRNPVASDIGLINK